MSLSLRTRRAAIALALGAGVIAVPTAIAAPSGESALTAGATFEQPLGSATSVAAAAGKRAYLVLFDPAAPATTISAIKSAVAANGGSVYAAYDAIGTLVTHSTSATFAADMRTVSGVQKVGATRTSDVPAAADNPTVPAAPAQSTPTASETSRYDMTIIGADRAWAVNQGSPDVVVGVLDTGVDDLHYDLKDNFLASKSASCAYGKLDTRPGAWREVHTHGTHVAGTIAAGKNGKGMVGVAPGVKIASVRVAEPTTSLFFPENTICSFVFAGDQGFDVTNNSYYVDPWMFNCPSDLDQGAILEGVKRAVAYAEGKGVLNVAASGNENYNLAAKSSDSSSPNDSTAVTRTVTNDCLDLPAELPGVVATSSITSTNAKSSFSNFGLNKIQIAAPGSGVYSTVPGGGYSSYDGTSMASPHVAGVAALLASVHPTETPAQLRARLNTQADDLACPSDTRCTGTTANNAFFGEGRVDAFEAVNTGTPGNTVTVTNPGNQTSTVGTAVSLQIQASDSDPNQTLTYSATGLPAGLAIGASSGLISGTPTTAASSSVTVTAKDTTNVSKSVTFTWTVGTTTPSGLQNGVPVTGLSGAKGAELRFTMTVPAGATNVKFTTSGGTGDPDLYAKFGSAPTTVSNDCKSEGSATAETCTITTAAAGTYHVLISGYSAFSGVSLTGSYQTDTTVALANGVGQGPLSGARGSSAYYKLEVPAGATGLRFTLAGGTGDADLYVRSGAKPTTTTYTCKSESSTTTETCTIGSITPGTYYVLVYGYSAFSGTTLTGSFTG